MEKMCMSPKDVADALGIGLNAAYSLCHREDFPAIRIGERRIVIPADAFRRWLDTEAGMFSHVAESTGR